LSRPPDARPDGGTIGIALIGLALLPRYRINSVWPIGAGAICGMIVQHAATAEPSVCALGHVPLAIFAASIWRPFKPATYFP
jgi:hypothetical protein